MPLNQVKISRYSVEPGKAELNEDSIAVEEPLQICLSQNEQNQVFSLTMRTPGDDKALVYGLLFSEGVIQHARDIESLSNVTSNDESIAEANITTVELANHVSFDLTGKERRHASYSGCGLCGKTSLKALALKANRARKPVKQLLDNQLIKALKELLAQQPLFSETGGVHAAGLIYQSAGKLQLLNSPFFEDVGRHNALDKLIGHELMTNDLQQAGILVLSGRIGFELVQKAVMAGFSTIVALGAPSHLAIQAANQFDIVLVGFAKDDRFNLYTSHADQLSQ
ncbi:MAG: formate dehydrogenase accessory sulfurtransferase FdhD [Kangiellaceae bacterium]|nr:formate dehydrogenase accessory sulfurtransferase FdhD [Kangiellaceae bacterium]